MSFGTLVWGAGGRQVGLTEPLEAFEYFSDEKEKAYF
jgi:hypothetical protein